MNKRLAALFFMVSIVVGAAARVETCSITISSLHVHITSGVNQDYAVALPPSVRNSVRITEQDNQLYINETYAAKGQRIDLRLPHGVPLKLTLKHNALVTIDDITAPLSARMRSGGGVFIKNGVCLDLEVDAQGPATLVTADAQIIAARLVLDGEVNAVLGMVKSLQQAQYGNGAAVWIDGAFEQAGTRTHREAFSIARSYRAVGQPLNDVMALYDQCATENPLVSGDECQEYAGNPFKSSNKAVADALTLLEKDLTAAGAAAAAFAAIQVIPAEFQTEKEVCGALLCRRMMLCTLAEPIGHGLVSPVSLLAVRSVPTSMRDSVSWMYEEMVKGAIAAVDQGIGNTLGQFGVFFTKSVTSLRRFRERLRQRSSANKLRWAPFLAQLYKDTCSFITNGERRWARAKA